MISTSVAFRRATDQGTLFIILYNEPLADSEETTVQLQIANANARPHVHICRQCGLPMFCSSLLIVYEYYVSGPLNKCVVVMKC